jgi:hypothetical protein
MPGGIGPCHPGTSTCTRTRPRARFRRLARRFGKGHEQKAAIAVARTLICIAWAVMTRGEDYADRLRQRRRAPAGSQVS